MSSLRGRGSFLTIRFLFTAGLLCAGMVQTTGAVRAAGEQFAMTASYGSGVHAYYSGKYQQSYEDFSVAVEAGSLDPRVFYFRGLAALKLGRSDEAQADFSEGAKQEAAGWSGRPVSRSLERVQGPDRLRLEQYRVRARVVAIKRDKEAGQRRYSEFNDAAPNVLRKPRSSSQSPEIDAAEPVNRQPLRPPVRVEDDGEEQMEAPVAEPAAEDPFGESTADETARPAPKEEPEVVEKEGGQEEMLPTDLPAEALPATDDPFGSEPPKPITKAAPEKPTAGTDDPFGDDSTPAGDTKADQKDEQAEMKASEGNDQADQKDEQAEMKASEGNDQADQKDEQAEMKASEGNDQADQKDEQMEMEAAAGDGADAVDEIKDDTTPL